ncbi:hypothetical protein VM95_18160 [Streptomyces rubellomurinus]|uniref:Uncharacterized protein n=1 Tax=Streptomyces rubellomurinus (strain ATCC 31215) TaxID=359131 RepID=A0A0F2TCQ6_STRR3|nr:hypothetical protein VM95_18160 [Streptomyces rubellomurinus]
MTLILEKCDGYCQGVDGRAGPNLACTGCGRAVATRIDDCGSEPHDGAFRDTLVGLPAIRSPRLRGYHDAAYRS